MVMMMNTLSGALLAAAQAGAAPPDYRIGSICTYVFTGSLVQGDAPRHERPPICASFKQG